MILLLFILKGILQFLGYFKLKKASILRGYFLFSFEKTYEHPFN